MIEPALIGRERERQQLLLRTLQRDAQLAELQGWVGDAPARVERACKTYRANAAASAERALAAAFPTVRALISADSFAALARAHWHANPPARGDLAWFGGALAEFIAANDQLADEPYLADCARLDWAVSRAEIAEDAHIESGTLALLGQAEPERIVLELTPGNAVLSSAYPIVGIWQAHQGEPSPDSEERFARVRAAFAAGEGQNAWLWRQGWRVRVGAVDAVTARFVRGLLAGRTLGVALDDAGSGLDFRAWLVAALQGGALQRARLIATAENTV